MITLHQKSNISGRFMIERYQRAPDGREVPGSREVVAPWQDNLITNSGLDNMATDGFMTRCQIGAGNAEPQVTDTALVSHMATSATGSAYSRHEEGPTGDGFNSCVGTYVFPPGVATGIIAELGVSGTSGPITTRALIRDENGSPTTITKGPIDELKVTYQLREYPDQGDTISQVTNPHTSEVYDVVVRGIDVGASRRMNDWVQYGPVRTSASWGVAAYGTGLVPVDSTPVSGATNLQSDGGVVKPYSPGDYFVDVDYTWTEGFGNIPGGVVSVRSRNITHSFMVQASFDPPIPKDNTKTLRITLRKSWGRHTP